MDFAFTDADKQRLKAEMRQEGYDLIAYRIRSEIVAEAKFTGPVFMVQLGQIDQREWIKWRQA